MNPENSSTERVERSKAIITQEELTVTYSIRYNVQITHKIY